MQEIMFQIKSFNEFSHQTSYWRYNVISVKWILLQALEFIQNTYNFLWKWVGLFQNIITPTYLQRCPFTQLLHITYFSPSPLNRLAALSHLRAGGKRHSGEAVSCGINVRLKMYTGQTTQTYTHFVSVNCLFYLFYYLYFWYDTVVGNTVWPDNTQTIDLVIHIYTYPTHQNLRLMG